MPTPVVLLKAQTVECFRAKGGRPSRDLERLCFRGYRGRCRAVRRVPVSGLLSFIVITIPLNDSPYEKLPLAHGVLLVVAASSYSKLGTTLLLPEVRAIIPLSPLPDLRRNPESTARRSSPFRAHRSALSTHAYRRSVSRLGRYKRLPTSGITRWVVDVSYSIWAHRPEVRATHLLDVLPRPGPGDASPGLTPRLSPGRALGLLLRCRGDFPAATRKNCSTPGGEPEGLNLLGVLIHPAYRPLGGGLTFRYVSHVPAQQQVFQSSRSVTF